MGRRKDVEDKLIGKVKSPKSDIVLFLYDEEPAYVKRKSGLFVPGTMSVLQSRWDRVGTIIAVGSRVQGLEPGDRVLVRKGYGLEVPHEHMAECKLVRISQDQIEAMVTGNAEKDDFDLERDGI